MPLSEEEVRQVFGDQTRSSAPALRAAANTNADQFAKRLSLASEQNLPVEVIEADDKEAERRRLVGLASEIDTKYPSTAKFLSDVTNAKLAHDDIETLTNLEDTLRRRNRSWYDNAIADVGRAFVSGVVKLPATLSEAAADTVDLGGRAVRRSVEAFNLASALTTKGEAGEAITSEDFSRMQEESEVSGRVPILSELPNPSEMLRGPARDLESVADRIGPRPENENLATDVAGAVPMLAGFIVQSIYAPHASIPTMWAIGMSEQAERQRRSGTYGTSDLAMVNAGAVEAVLERTGLDKILELVPQPVRRKVMSRVVDVLATGGVDGGTEFGQAISQGVIEKMTTNPSLDVYSKIVDPAAREGDVGAILGVLARSIVLGARSRGAGSRIARNDALRYIASGEDQKWLDQAIDLQSKSTLNQRASEKFAEWLGGTPKGHNIYVDKTVFDSITDLPDYIEEQLHPQNRSDDVVIPMQTFLSDTVARKDLMALIRPHIRRDAEALSQTDMQSGGMEIAKRLVAKEKLKKTDLDEAEAAYEEIVEQIVATGRQSESTARASAQVIPAFAVTMAKERNVPVKEILDLMFKDMGMQVKGQADTAVATTGALVASVPQSRYTRQQNFGDITIDDDVVVEETGETAKVTQPVAPAWKELHQRRSAIEAVVRCVNR